MSQERESHNGFEKSATFYLEAANTALLSGQPRLAIHLFRAAYEIESTYGTIISSAVIEGLRKAWELACELGDRSAAESIFSDLSAYNSLEQNEQAGLRLQALALSQLEDMGVTEDDLESIAGALTHELANSDHEELFDSLRSMLEQLGVTSADIEGSAVQAIMPPLLGNGSMGKEDAALSETSDAKAGSEAAFDACPNPDPDPKQEPPCDGLAKIGKQLMGLKGRRYEAPPNQQLNYETLAGYTQAMERMREYGFIARADEHRRNFVQRAAAMHGISRFSFNGAFLFTGSSREDTSLFAHATAGEIGTPVFQVVVDLDAQGNGTIKLIGPFRRGFFGGPPDIMDMATPCTVLIENIDFLQTMFNNEQIAMQRHGGRPKGMMPGMGRSMQAEIGGYLRALRQKPGIIMLATAQDAKTLKEPLRGILEPMNEIDILAPSQSERRDILCTFATEHPSFAELNVDRIVHFSEGLSRNELVLASHTAVEQAYRESLRSGTYSRVTLGDVLIQLAAYVDHGSPLYQQIEDETVAQFSYDIGDNLLPQ